MSDARDTTGPTERLTPLAPAAAATTPLVPPPAPAADAATEVFPPAGPVASAGLAQSAPATPPAAPRPTIRWGALVWALIFATIAAVTLWIIVDPERRDAADTWLMNLNPFAAGLYALIVVGVVVALFGIVGLIRRGERTRSRGAELATPERPSRHHGDSRSTRGEI